MADQSFDDARDYEAYLEQSVVVMLRDGRYLYGTMKSFDQFNSITLDGVIERIFHGRKYAEKRHELFIIRGENIAVIGLAAPEVASGLVQADFSALRSEAQGAQP